MPRRKTLEEIKQTLYDMYKDNYTIISTIYQGSNSPLRLRCNIHNTEFSETWSKINMGRINCKICKTLKYKKARTKKPKDYLLECLSKGLDIPVEDYIDSHTPIFHRCPRCNNIYKQSPTSHLQGKGCRICGHFDSINNRKGHTKRKTPKEYYDLCKEKGLDLPIEDYINATTKIKHRCSRGHVYEQRPSSHLKGLGCSTCNESHGERFIRNYLDKHNIKYIPQKKFHDLKDKDYLSYDFYLPEYNTLIEYQGIQHYESINFKGNGKYSNLEKQQEHDRLKQRFAKDNGYRLLRPTYKTNTQEKINRYLDRYLLKTFDK